jgi:glutamate 5-kinase
MKQGIYNKIVVKIGSNVITRENGFPDIERIETIVAQLAALKKQKVDVVLVSSGAVACGRSIVKITDNTDPVSERQQLAAVGQIKLINTYAELFGKHEITCAQVLVTKGDFRDRKHYLNMKSCITNLLKNNIIPVVNENDVIAVTELMFTDNDELSGLMASMIGAEALILLTSVDGLYNGNPNAPDSVLIPLIGQSKMDFSFISHEKSNFGRGGMVTKSRMAYNIAQMGIAVHIANGKTTNILTKILAGENIGTRFEKHKKTSQIKRWIAHAESYAKGKVYINNGAATALLQIGKASSLLPVGIVAIEENFEKGDAVKILSEKGKLLGIGLANYSSEKAMNRIGIKNQPAFIHYDYLFLNP